MASVTKADLRQKASSATLPERLPLPSFLLPPLSSHSLSLPSLSFSSLSSPLLFPPLSPPLEVGPSNPARESGEHCKLPSRVCRRAQAEIEFGTF